MSCYNIDNTMIRIKKSYVIVCVTLRVALSQQDNDQVIRYAVLKNVNTHTQKKRK